MTTKQTEVRVPITGRLRKLLAWMLPANLGVFILWGAIPGLLLALQLEQLDAANKVANLAWVSSMGAFAAMLAQPIAGAISDRTRSKFGRRAPWMVGGALIGGLALIGMASANSVVQVAIAWTIVQVAYNFVQGPLSAILPDRVPVRARGTFAAVGGAAAMLGALGGQIVGSTLGKSIGAGYLMLAGLALVTTVLFVVFNPDESSKDLEASEFQLKDFLHTFWVSPVKYPDFAWAFIGRLLLYLGYFSVMGYNLYLLSDHIGLGTSAALGYVPILGIISLAAMLPMILISGPISDRMGRRKIFVFISSVIVGLGLIVPWVWPTVGGAIVLAFGYAGLFPVGIFLSILGAFAVFMIKSVR